MIDEILSTVDDTTFGESILTYFHSERKRFYFLCVVTIFFQTRRAGMMSSSLVAH
jgi:hypothetical protein